LQTIADEQGIKITELAELMGFERSVPSSWKGREKRGKDPDYRSLIRVAECLQLSTDWLAGRDAAERWSPAVLRAQDRMRTLAKQSPDLTGANVQERAAWAWEQFRALVPGLDERIWALYLHWTVDDWTSCLAGQLPPGPVQIDGLEKLTGLPARWYRDGNTRCLEDLPSTTMARLEQLMAAENLDPDDLLNLVQRASGK
jgi:transcriptional regulator with XRE-family HTH domain